MGGVDGDAVSSADWACGRLGSEAVWLGWVWMSWDCLDDADCMNEEVATIVVTDNQEQRRQLVGLGGG